MPSNSDVLGFSNQWYPDGIRNKVSKSLPNGTKIFIFSPEFYLASKFESHNNRGGNDLRQSHDFEDIVYILDNIPEIEQRIMQAQAPVKSYLKQECQKLYRNPSLIEGLECALPYGSGDDRAAIIEDLIKRIAETH